MREITHKDLESMSGLTLVEIYKPGCQPCEQLDPILEKISNDPEYKGSLQFAKSHSITGGIGQGLKIDLSIVPQLILFKDGVLLERFTGARYAHGFKGERVAIESSQLTERIDKLLLKYEEKDAGKQTLTMNNPKYTLENRLGTSLPLSDNSLIALAERYLKKDDNGKVIETPEDMFKRIAESIAEVDKNYNGSNGKVEETARKFYDMISSLDFLPNSPTIMNAGRELGQLSACFVLPVGDSIDEIFEAAKMGALVHKSGGGTGYSFSRLRPKNSRVKTTKGIASGPVSFIYVFNTYTEVVKQGGTRRGANMGILAVNHPDILDFISAKGEPNEITAYVTSEVARQYGLTKDDPIILTIAKTLRERAQLQNLNLSVGITEGFMEAVEKDVYWSLIDPQTHEIREKVKAKSLLERIVHQAWKSGEPGVVFLDKINEDNPTPQIGEIEATNPCGEQPLLPFESCNLGSINLTKHIKKSGGTYSIDFDKLKGTVHTAVHFLDNVIDANRYPLAEIDAMTKANRKIGLGIMGFADMLSMLSIPYGSNECISLAEQLMRFIRDEARSASTKLAEERGVFPNWEGSIYDSKSPHFKGEGLKLRNATLTTIAPTGSLSIIADCEAGIESYFSVIYTRTVMDGKVLSYKARGLESILKEKGYDANHIFEELAKGNNKEFEKLPVQIKDLGRTAMQLTPEQHIRVQSAFQKYTDNAVSKTVNLPYKATEKEAMEVYKLAYKLGCKGVTIYRNKSRDTQVIEETGRKPISTATNLERILDSLDFSLSPEELNSLKDTKLPKERLAIVRQEATGDEKYIFVTTSYFESKTLQKIIERLRETGIPTEFFTNANHFDPRTHSLVTALSIRLSKDLRHGISYKKIAKDLENTPPSDETGYDVGFGEDYSYVNRSIPAALSKAISGWVPPTNQARKNLSKRKEDKDKQEVEQPKGNGDKSSEFGFCPKCNTFGVINQEGCDKCINCDYSQKGCFK